jgi:hypothetical protein
LAKKKKKKKSGFAFWAPKKKRKKTKAQVRAAKEATFTRIRIFSAILGVVFVLAAVCVGFFYMEKYVGKVSPVAKQTGKLEFPNENKPEWFNEELARLIRETVGGKEEVFALNEKSAQKAAQKLTSVKWLDDLKVQTTSDSLRVTATYLKPVAKIKFRNKMYNIAIKGESLVAMRYLDIAKLPIVEIIGSRLRSIDDVGDQDDIEEAIKLIGLLSAMDTIRKVEAEMKAKERIEAGIEGEMKPAPPLLNEIASIDVSNFNGRKNKSKSESHINLIIKDGTLIKWGNEIGKTTGLIQATDNEKLASLYRSFTEYGKNTLLNKNLKYIDLRKPRGY